MKNIFSMDDPTYSKRGYFDAVFDKQSYLNMVFALIHFPLSLLSVTLLIISFIPGVLFFFFWIGAPLLNISFMLAWQLADKERWLLNKLYNENIPAVTRPAIQFQSQLKLFYMYVRKFRTWRYLLYHFVKFGLSLLLFLLPFILVGFGLMLIYAPFKAMFGHIQIFTWYQTDSFIEAIFIFFIGLILWMGIINLINAMTWLLIKASKHFLGR